MEEGKDYLRDLSEIRSMMERSSRFISLSGLTGVMAGIYALLGAFFAYKIIYHSDIRIYDDIRNSVFSKQVWLLVLDALVVMLLAVGTGIFITTRKAKSKGLKIWDGTARRLVVNLLIPLITGGVFIIILLFRGYFGILTASTLVFYGLGLVNASKYTLSDIRYLGLTEIVLGLFALTYPGSGLLFWSVGFGFCHIIYGSWMYFRHEK